MNSLDARGAATNRLIALVLGLLALLVYLSTSSFSFHSIDEFAVFTVARSLTGHGQPDADVLYWTRDALGRTSIAAGGIDGHTYVVKDVAPSLLITPLVWAANHLPISPIRTVLLLSPVVTALTTALLYLIVLGWGYRRGAAIMGALVFAFGSLAWPYAETLFTQPLAALGLIIALHATLSAREHDSPSAALAGGLGLGLAGLSAIPTWITLPIYLLCLVPWQSLRDRTTWRHALVLELAFGLGAGLSALMQGFYNLARFGSMLETGYQRVGVADFRLENLPIGLFGQIASTPRGLIWYAPFVLLIPFSLWIGWRSANRSRLLLAAAQAGSILFFYSAYGTWWGGLGWGPRFLVATMPALTLLAIPLLDRLLSRNLTAPAQAACLAVLTLSVVTQLLASIADLYPSDVPLARNLAEMAPLEFHPVLISASTLPWPRELDALRNGAWEILALSDQPPDFPLLAAQIITIALSTVSILWVMRRAALTNQWIFACQLSLVAALTAWMLLRYPHGPNAVPGIDTLVESVSARTQPVDGIIVLLPNSIFDWIDTYDSHSPDIGVSFEDPLTDHTTNMLEQASGWHERIWLVSEGTVGGNPANGVEHWLASHAYIGTELWIDGYRLVPYTFPVDTQPHPIDRSFGEEITLSAASIDVSRGWINVWLRWEARSQPQTSYTIFIHLLDSTGALIAQHDGLPAAGYAPTPRWTPGQLIDDRRSIILPAALPSGQYQLFVGLYDSAGTRLPMSDGSGDALLLETLTLGE